MRRHKKRTKRSGLRGGIHRVAVAMSRKLRKARGLAAPEKKGEGGGGDSTDGTPPQREFTYAQSIRALAKRRRASDSGGANEGGPATAASRKGCPPGKDAAVPQPSSASPISALAAAKLAEEEMERRRRAAEAWERSQARQKRRMEREERERRERARRMERERLAREGARKGCIAELEVPETSSPEHGGMQLGS